MRIASASQDVSPWRFSLRTLFLLTFVVAVFVWIISRPLWDMDERLVLGTGYLTIAAGLAWNHLGDWRNKWSWLAWSGFIPAITALVFDRSGKPLIGLQEDFVYFFANAGAIFVVASLAWLVAVRILSPGRLNELSPLRRADAMQRRLAWAAAFGGVLAIAIGAASWYRGKTRWKEQVFLPHVTDLDHSFESYREENLALSPDGKLLAAFYATDDGERKAGYVRVWNIEPHRPVELFKFACDDVSALVFTDDGQLLLYKRGSNRPIRTVDAVSGREMAGQPSVPVQAIPFWTRTGSEELQMASPDGSWILRALRKLNDYKHQYFELSVLDPGTKETRRIIGQFWGLPDIEISSMGNLLAIRGDGSETYDIGGTLWNLRSEKSISVPWIVWWFSIDERRAFGLESFNPYESYPAWMGEWFFELPVLRHLWMHGIHERFVEFDATTGETIRRSQWINSTHLDNPTISKDGNVAAAWAWSGHVTIWRAP